MTTGGRGRGYDIRREGQPSPELASVPAQYIDTSAPSAASLAKKFS